LHDLPEKGTTLLTPEQVRLQYRTAGIGSRVLAHLVDALLMLAAALLILLGFAGAMYLLSKTWLPSSGSDYLVAIMIILMLVVVIGYFIGMEAYRGGQTVGKKAFGLRVVNSRGGSASLLSVIIRNLFRLIDLLPVGYFAGAVAMMFSPSDKRIGDMVAGTVVVLESGAENKKRRTGVERKLLRLQKTTALPELALTEEQRKLVTPEDWQLLQGWAERLEPSPERRMMEMEYRIFIHFTERLGHLRTLYAAPAAYLAALYMDLRGDWEF